MTQKEIVFSVMRAICPARTEQIKIEAMRRGVSCADRRMRELAAEGQVKNIGKRNAEDKTDTWIIKRLNPPAYGIETEKNKVLKMEEQIEMALDMR